MRSVISADKPCMPDIEPATFVRDGIAIMEAQSLFLFTVRAMIMLVVWCMAQLPPAWKVEVDVNQIIRAITMERNGSRVDAGPWREAPTLEQFTSQAVGDTSSTTSSTSGSVSRVQAHADWKAYCESRKSIVPSKHASYNGPPAKSDLLDEDEGPLVEEADERSEDDEEDTEDHGNVLICISISVHLYSPSSPTHWWYKPCGE